MRCLSLFYTFAHSNRTVVGHAKGVTSRVPYGSKYFAKRNTSRFGAKGAFTASFLRPAVRQTDGLPLGMCEVTVQGLCFAQSERLDGRKAAICCTLSLIKTPLYLRNRPWGLRPAGTDQGNRFAISELLDGHFVAICCGLPLGFQVI
jgi:hypothetical protein